MTQNIIRQLLNEKKLVLTELSIYLVASIIAIGAGTIAGIGAINGIAVGSIVSFIPTLSPLVIGGIVGAALPLLLLTASTILACFTSDHENRVKNTAIAATKAIAITGASFGIGVGLSALGLTSPAVIGALAALVFPVTYLLVCLLIGKAVEHFSSKGKEEVGSKLDSNEAVDNRTPGRC